LPLSLSFSSIPSLSKWSLKLKFKDLSN
jgi:hypothetical protein